MGVFMLKDDVDALLASLMLVINNSINNIMHATNLNTLWVGAQSKVVPISVKASSTDGLGIRDLGDFSELVRVEVEHDFHVGFDRFVGGISEGDLVGLG